MWLNGFVKFIYKTSMILAWITILTKEFTINLWIKHILPHWCWQKLHIQKAQSIRLCILKLFKKKKTLNSQFFLFKLRTKYITKVVLSEDSWGLEYV